MLNASYRGGVSFGGVDHGLASTENLDDQVCPRSRCPCDIEGGAAVEERVRPVQKSDGRIGVSMPNVERSSKHPRG